MTCTRIDDLHESCLTLDVAFKNNTRFILGVKNNSDELTHAQLMKIRCGGLIGMTKVLNIDNDECISIRSIIDKITIDYSSIEGFPFDRIVQDIKKFKHRK